MYKDEFLVVLRECLQGEIPDYKVEENIRYYADYISDSSDGKTEEEKLQELGDPHLIARTIIDTAEIKTDPLDREKETHNYYYDDGRGRTEQQYESYTTSDTSGNYGSHIFSFTWNHLKWYQKALAILILLLLVVALFAIILVGIKVFLTVILPILLVLFVIQFVLAFINRRR